MNKSSAYRIIEVHLKKKFNSFIIKKRLSDFAFTFSILGDGKHYVVKLIEKRNVVSRIIHDKKHVSKVVLAVSSLKDSPHILSIDLIDYFLSEKYSIFLLKKESLCKIKKIKIRDFKILSQAIFNFHDACKNITFKSLPWNNFPQHFKEALKNHGRWGIVSSFLVKSSQYINKQNLVVCHNDIHAGNVYYSKQQVCFIDLDDMCKSSCFNDLGSLLANFMDSNCSDSELLQIVGNIFKGYNLKMSKNNILSISIFSLRKLYFTEAYFLYANKKNAQSLRFVYEIRAKQNIIKNFMENYL